MSTKWLYVTDVYDGPMAGMVTHDGEMLWARWANEADYDQQRIFELWRMPDAWMATEAEEHAAWNTCCGNYSFDLPEGHRPTRMLEDFYAKYPPGTRKGPSEVDGAVLVTTVNKHTIEYPEKP